MDPAASCPNPTPVTLIKCVYWGGPVDLDNAVNYGQYREQFHVVIAGSNGYTNNSIATPPGYDVPVYLGTSAIMAPPDPYGFDSYMGVAMFNSGPFDIQLCADACTLRSQYALANPPTDGSPAITCQVCPRCPWRPCSYQITDIHVLVLQYIHPLHQSILQRTRPVLRNVQRDLVRELCDQFRTIPR